MCLGHPLDLSEPAPSRFTFHACHHIVPWDMNRDILQLIYDFANPSPLDRLAPWDKRRRPIHARLSEQAARTQAEAL